MHKLSAVIYFIILTICIMIILIILILESPNLPEPLSFNNALSQVCTGIDLPFNDGYYSFWSILLIILFWESVNYVIDFFKLLITTSRQKKYPVISDDEYNRLKSIINDQKNQKHSLVIIFSLLNVIVYFYGLVEYLSHLPISSTILCKIMFIVSSSLYKGIFGSFWRSSIGVWYLIFNTQNGLTYEGSTFTQEAFTRNIIFFVSWIAPICLGLIIIVFLIPLALIFFPIFIIYIGFIELSCLLVVYGIGYFAFKQSKIIKQEIISNAREINDRITILMNECSDDSENDKHMAILYRSILMISYISLLYFLVLYSPFYTGTNWSDVVEKSLTFFIPSRIYFDFVIPKIFTSVTISSSVLGSELLLRIFNSFLNANKLTSILVDNIIVKVKTMVETVIIHQEEKKIEREINK
jgi:hypothetical protein